MEYLIGAIVAGTVLFFFVVKNKINYHDKQTLLQFPAWHALYLSSAMPETHGMARSFVTQTLHLAYKTGAITTAEKQELDQVMRRENPIRVVDEWLQFTLPRIITICGEPELAGIDARLLGVFIVVCNKSLIPERDLKRFLRQFST